MSERIYFKNLDILRFFAFFLVFWSHAFDNIFGHNYPYFIDTILTGVTKLAGEGVKIFFVLSGFLITYLLCVELKGFGKINIPFFYIRRVLRIWPLYYLILIPSLFFLPYVSSVFVHTANKILVLSFLTNFDALNHEIAKITYNSNIAIAWSVAIEEQFYLTWPILFALIVRNKYVFYGVTSCIVVASFIYQLCAPWQYAYYHTFGNVAYLILGAMGGHFMATNNSGPRLIAFLEKYKTIIFWFFAVLLICRRFTIMYYPGLILLPVLYLLVVLIVSFGQNKAFDKMGVFRELGKYSYGLYFYHPLVIIFCKVFFDLRHWDYRNSTPALIGMGICALVGSCVVAYFSYTVIEKRFILLKDKFSFVHTTPPVK